MILSLTKGLAIGASLWAGGAMSSVSLTTIPAFLLGPHSIAAKQFKLMHGPATALSDPAASLAPALLHGFLAWKAYQQIGAFQGAARTWAAAAALSAAILPFTIAVLEPVARQLLAIAGTGEKREGGTEVAEKTEGLLRSWRALNGVRCLLAAGAGVLGLWTVLGDY